jgi:putative phosphoesterase
MRVAIYSDVHGNLPALELAIKDAASVDGYIVLGDVVNYGPWSNECVELIDSLKNCIKISGNHEEYFIEGKCGSENYMANEFFNHCYGEFRNFSAIQMYEKEVQFEEFICIHTIDNKYIFEDSDITLGKNYIIGHSHRQYSIERSGYLLLNPGSVGQNRQYINEINFMIYDTTTKNVDFRSVLYDVDEVIGHMEIMEYPQICVDYYRKKPRK